MEWLRHPYQRAIGDVLSAFYQSERSIIASNGTQPRAHVLKRYWINPRFQARIILYAMAMAALVILSTALTVHYFFENFADIGREIGLVEGHVFFQFLSKQQSFMNQLVLGLSLFLGVTITIFGLILSHRIAGPLQRLNQHLLSLAAHDDRGPIAFRSRDYFKEIADSYNLMYAERIAKKIAAEEPPMQ